MANDTTKPRQSAKKTMRKKSTTKKTKSKYSGTSNKTDKKQSRVESNKRQLDEIITGTSSGAEKKKAIDKINKQLANDIIKVRPSDSARKKSGEELKKKASAAKRGAQEKILEQSYVHDPDDHLKRLADTFDTSARRWEMVVYPSLFAFILLAGYGFYLIFHLTHDISVLSQSVTRMATIVSTSMPKMTRDISDMTGSVDNMSGEISTMSNQMTTLTPISQNLANMTGTMHQMNRSVYGMQRDMSGMNRTVSGGPFGMMNDMMPFSTNSYSQPPPPMPAMRPMIAQPVPRYAQTRRPAPNMKYLPSGKNKMMKPSIRKPPFVKDEIVNNNSSTNMVKKN